MPSALSQESRRGPCANRPRAVLRAAASLIAVLASRAAVAEDGEVLRAVDLAPASPYLDFAAEGVIQNIILGAGAEIAFTSPGSFATRVRASYSFDVGVLPDPVGMIFPLGMDGLKAQAGFDWTFASAKREERIFRKISLVDSDMTSETWLGYYYAAPYRESHHAGLDVLLESTGALVRGWGPSSSAPVWYPAPSYSLYLYPHYKYSWYADFIAPGLEGFASEQRVKRTAFVSVGPLFCPDFTQFGAASDFGLVTGLGPVALVVSGMAGVAFPVYVPEGDAIDGKREPAGLIDGYYIPYRISIGLTVPIAFGPREASE